jgi:hypothetical protein
MVHAPEAEHTAATILDIPFAIDDGPVNVILVLTVKVIGPVPLFDIKV